MESHAENVAERLEEVRDKFGTPIGGDMRRNAVLRENMKDKELCELFGGDGIVCWDVDSLLCETIDDDKDRCESRGWRKVFDEIHRD